ncbi:MAG TPA: hypothetical protein ENH10_10465, partial [Bacteroidetes bacterium]|nr:hypothetical protein [Bacteroidota bacterium]HEX05555.1 hypothetical protein [Bacteroidota bacterium]
MMRRHIFSTVLLVMLFVTVAVPVHSQIIAETAVVTDYMWRGFNVLNNAPAVQPTVTGILGDTGFDVNAWFSFALRDRYEQAIRDLDEMDLTLTYSRSIGAIDMRAGIFTYHLFTQDDYPDEATFVREAFGGITLTTLPLSPWITYNYELLKEGGNDWYLEAGLEHVIALSSGQPVVFSAHTGWYKADWGDLGGEVTDISLSVSLPIETGRLSIVPWLTASYTP